MPDTATAEADKATLDGKTTAEMTSATAQTVESKDVPAVEKLPSKPLLKLKDPDGKPRLEMDAAKPVEEKEDADAPAETRKPILKLIDDAGTLAGSSLLFASPRLCLCEPGLSFCCLLSLRNVAHGDGRDRAEGGSGADASSAGGGHARHARRGSRASDP
jgi:hypothetical protein